MKNHELYKQVLTDMRHVLNREGLTFSQKLDALEWREEFIREFCF